MEPTSLGVQIMMATSLAACAGLRAWLPLLVMGGLGRAELVPLHGSFEFLSSTPALFVFGVATVFELLADKIIAVDHMLDAMSTFARPMAGTVLAASSLTDFDPLLATVCGLALGGGTALTVHTGKAVVRAKSSALAPFHGGLGNAFLSLVEDAAAALGVPLAVFAPLVAFVVALLVLVLAVVAVIVFVRAGKHVMKLLFEGRRESAEP